MGTRERGKGEKGRPGVYEVAPMLAELGRLAAAAGRRSELGVKGSNALVSVVGFFAAVLQEGEAREDGLRERLAAAEQRLVGSMVFPGQAHQRHRDALLRLLESSPEGPVLLGDEQREALRFVLGAQ